MSDSKRRLMLLFSSEQRKEAFERMIKDISEVNNGTLSGTTENLLAKGLLPQNEHAAWYAEYFLYNSSWPDSVRKTLRAIFETAGAGIYGKPRWDPESIKPYVEFARKNEQLCLRKINPNNEDLHYLSRRLDSIKEVLEKNIQNSTESESVLVFKKDELKEITKSLEIIESQPQDFKPLVVYNAILNNWKDLADLQVTYRCLCALVTINDSNMTNEKSRYNLMDLLLNSNTWD